MGSWYKVAFPTTEAGHVEGASLQYAFEMLFNFRGKPNEAALFIDRSSSSGTRQFYFSPGAVLIAGVLLVAHGAVACSAPRRDEVMLCVGDSSTAFRLL